nr:hypothetical protein Iba_chr02aCG20490 [Ipomoea batatas]
MNRERESCVGSLYSATAVLGGNEEPEGGNRSAQSNDEMMNAMQNGCFLFLLALLANFTAASKNSATLTKSSSTNPLDVRAGVPGLSAFGQARVKDRKQMRKAHALFAREAFCEEDGHKRSALPIRMPPGTMAETSPGTVFLLAAICTNSKTFSTREPSIPCKKKSQCSRMLRNEIDIHFSLICHRL